MVAKLPAIPERKEDLLTIANGQVKIGIDREKGGSITYISSAGYSRNIVNYRDPGRLIQQSYYAGIRRDRRQEGQGKHWSPWSWNPIQGGGIGSWAEVTAFERLNEHTLYSETIPNLWDMPNEPAAALMKQWTRFEEGLPNTIVVQCELQCDRDENDPWGPAVANPQEVPACYFTRNFHIAKSYLGDGEWQLETDPPGLPWTKASPPLQAMAFFEESGQGIAVFSPTAGKSWNFGSSGGPNNIEDPTSTYTMHVAPVVRVNLGPKSNFNYRYWLVLGTETEIAASLDVLIEKYENEEYELTNSSN
ncbi:hypothetical protein IEN85_19160 [Pelagicoccus sp. NFK12]|uniref:Uncharacterized protein n=1 Tax=Pelagicoccus enzymogenes TaxID=2773457 RepID=A0A927FB57_9BACT|nr:hypothetical protein [Pelagicoccus enzymogenes]